MEKSFGILNCCLSLATAFLATFALAEPPARVIGALAELSGPYAAIGEECRQGWMIAEHTLGPKIGDGVRIVYADSQRDPRTGISEFRKLVDVEHVLGVVFNGSPIAMALNPISHSQRIPILGTVSHPKFTETNPYAYRLWTTSRAEGKALARRALEMGHRRIAVLTLEDEWPITVSNAFEEEITRGGGKIVFSDTTRKEEAEFSGIASRMRPHTPDAIFVNIVGDQLASIIRRFRELGFQQQLFTSWSLGRPEVLRASPARNAEGAIFVEMDGERPWLSAQMKENFGSPRVTSLQYGCFLAMWVTLATLAENADISDAASLHAKLAQTTSFTTPDGPIRFHERDAQMDLVLREIRDGEVVRIGFPRQPTHE